MKTLVFCDDPWHPAATVQSGLAGLGAQGFDFEFLSASADWPVARLAQFPLALLAKANLTSATVAAPWLTLDSSSAFPDFLRRGHGLVVVHAGCSRYDQLPAMRAVLGGSLVRHPAQCPVTLAPVAGHPVTAGVVPFTVPDEPYFMTLHDHQSEVFLQARSEHGEQPAGWTRSADAGRVCVLTPGHGLEVWQHPSFQRLLLNALRWAAKLN